jgi:formylglycine-generating enzyme required for sulfatase activity
MPEKIGKYDVVERIGRGGMGTIFKAHDPVLDRLVALKVISSDVHVTDELRTRFFREAQACARLAHPNIVTVHDMGEHEGQLYIVMELLDGEELRALIAQGRDLTLEDRLGIMVQVCDGLDYAHTKGVIHRDIKPHNIMVLRTGQVKILDFGIARLSTAESGLTRTGLVMGTLRYIAPEQVRGMADHRSDIFSVGAVFDEFWSGRPPFSAADPMQLLEQLRTEDPPTLSEINPAIPPALSASIARAMRKEPAERFAQLAEMRALLAQVRADLAEEARALRGHLTAQREELGRLRAALAERIGPIDHEDTGAASDDPSHVAALRALEGPLAERIAALQARLAQADALHPTYERGLERLHAGDWPAAVAALLGVLREMPEHARAGEAMAQARAAAEEAERRQRAAQLVDAARGALQNGGAALCLELLRQARQIPCPVDLAESIASLQETADAALAMHDVSRDAERQAEQARQGMAQARRRAQAWGAALRAAEPWNEAERNSAEGYAALAGETYAEATVAFEQAAALYRRSEEQVRDSLQTLGSEQPGQDEQTRQTRDVRASGNAAADPRQPNSSAQDAPESDNSVLPAGHAEVAGGPGDGNDQGETRTIVAPSATVGAGAVEATDGDPRRPSPPSPSREAPRPRHADAIGERASARPRRGRSVAVGLGVLAVLAIVIYQWAPRPAAPPSGSAGGVSLPNQPQVPGPPPVVPPEAPRASGSLAIVSNVAGVEVWVGDHRVGVTPAEGALVVTDLPPGTHRVRATKTGHRDWQQEATIGADQRTQVAIDITPLEPARDVAKPVGSLTITSSLAGVDVWLDDKKIGETRAGRALVPNDLPLGRHRLKASKVGHRDWEREITVAADRRNHVVIDIKPLGAGRVSKEDDGAEMVLVPAGPFWMGSTRDEVDRAIEECGQARMPFPDSVCRGWMERELPRHRVSLDAFYIDKVEVTNALFQRFVQATGYQTVAEREGWSHTLKDGKPDRGYGLAWRSPRGPISVAAPALPVGYMSWHDADAYCKWAGKRLPTEAEWEKAARGTDERRFPWGNTWDPARANGDAPSRGAMPVGDYPAGASPYGALDMAGNVFEWVADWFEADYYARSAERNPRGPESGRTRVLRGGSAFWAPMRLRTTVRATDPSDFRYSQHGFRCAKSAP